MQSTIQTNLLGRVAVYLRVEGGSAHAVEIVSQYQHQAGDGPPAILFVVRRLDSGVLDEGIMAEELQIPTVPPQVEPDPDPLPRFEQGPATLVESTGRAIAAAGVVGRPKTVGALASHAV